MVRYLRLLFVFVFGMRAWCVCMCPGVYVLKICLGYVKKSPETNQHPT